MVFKVERRVCRIRGTVVRSIKKMLVGNGNDIMKKSAIWNIISSMEYSMQSAILLLVVTRLGGLYDAGLFTIAYTFTQMMATVGSYGMRSFQVSDVKTEYKFGTYLYSRVISVTVMLVACVSYAVIQQYDSKKIFLFFLLCMYRVVDDYEDVFHGEMQKNMRLDIASKIVAIRIFVATVMFAIAYAVSKDIVIACLALTVTAILVSIVLNAVVIGEFKGITFKLSRENGIRLLWTCLPICVSGFLYNYLANAPKYAIDRNLSEEMQTLFSILFMPIFVINILSSFIFKPMIASMGIMWSNKKYKEFIGSVVKQMLLIVGMTVGIMFFGGLCGVEVLGWMYGVKLTEYRLLFVLLLTFGGFAATVAFFVVVLTIVRKQQFIVVAYIVSALTNLLLANKMVLKHGIWGAGIMYGLTMGMIVIMLLVTFVLTIRKEKRGAHNGAIKEDLS